MTRIERIEQALRQALAPTQLAIDDDSAQHAGHAGAATGRGHFSVTIVAAAFAGKSPIERHRMVYAALGPLMQSEIHALSIRALAPAEAPAETAGRA